MESSPLTPAEARATLAGVERSRDSFTHGVRLPRGFHALLGAAIAVHIATAAIGAAEQSTAGITALVVGLLVFVAVAAVQLFAFRRLNGVWLGGLASRVVFGTGAEASTAYTLALGLAVWAAFEQAWWLVIVLATAGGAAYAVAGIRWMRTYREDPVRHGRGESAWMLALMAVTMVAAGVLLLVNH